MIHKTLLKAAAAASLLMVSSMAAQADGFALGAKVSTLGIGPEVTVGLTDGVNIRVGANFFSMDKTLTKGGNEFDFNLNMENYTAFADFHVFGGGFRVTGGAMYNKGNNLTGIANSANDYDINGVTYTSAQVGDLRGELLMGSEVSPYLGIGFGDNISGGSGLSFNFDLGVFFTGVPKTNLTTTGGTLQNNAAAYAILQENLARETDNIRNDIKDFKYYPMVSLSIAYRF
jgi:hypothetical protein